MKRRAAFKCAGAAALALSAVPSRAAHSAVDPRLKDAVQRANNEWLVAMQTGDAAVIAAAYAQLGVFTLSDGSSIQGRHAIEEMYRRRFDEKGHAVGATIDSKRLEQDGDLAYEWGSATVQMHAGTGGGRYLTVWQRQPDGDWQIVRNLVFPADRTA